MELVTKDNNRGLILCSFDPSSLKVFWTLKTEIENQKAHELCVQVAKFTDMENLGFTGHKFQTNQIGIEDGTEFVKHIFF